MVLPKADLTAFHCVCYWRHTSTESYSLEKTIRHLSFEAMFSRKPLFTFIDSESMKHDCWVTTFLSRTQVIEMTILFSTQSTPAFSSPLQTLPCRNTLKHSTWSTNSISILNIPIDNTDSSCRQHRSANKLTIRTIWCCSNDIDMSDALHCSNFQTSCC